MQMNESEVMAARINRRVQFHRDAYMAQKLEAGKPQIVSNVELGTRQKPIVKAVQDACNAIGRAWRAEYMRWRDAMMQRAQQNSVTQQKEGT